MILIGIKNNSKNTQQINSMQHLFLDLSALFGIIKEVQLLYSWIQTGIVFFFHQSSHIALCKAIGKLDNIINQSNEDKQSSN